MCVVGSRYLPSPLRQPALGSSASPLIDSNTGLWLCTFFFFGEKCCGLACTAVSSDMQSGPTQGLATGLSLTHRSARRADSTMDTTMFQTNEGTPTVPRSGISSSLIDSSLVRVKFSQFQGLPRFVCVDQGRFSEAGGRKFYHGPAMVFFNDAFTCPQFTSPDFDSLYAAKDFYEFAADAGFEPVSLMKYLCTPRSPMILWELCGARFERVPNDHIEVIITPRVPEYVVCVDGGVESAHAHVPPFVHKSRFIVREIRPKKTEAQALLERKERARAIRARERALDSGLIAQMADVVSEPALRKRKPKTQSSMPPLKPTKAESRKEKDEQKVKSERRSKAQAVAELTGLFEQMGLSADSSGKAVDSMKDMFDAMEELQSAISSGFGGLEPHSGIMNGVGTAITSALTSAGRAVGTGVAEAIRDTAPDVATSVGTAFVEGAVDGASVQAGAIISRLADRIRQSITAVCEMFRTATGSPVGEFVVKFFTYAIPICLFAGLVRYTGIDVMILRGVSTMLGFGVPEEVFSPQFGEKGESDTIGKVMLAAMLAAIVPIFGSASKCWRPVVDIVAKGSAFATGAAHLVDWVLDGLQWLLNIFITRLGGEEVKWYTKRADDVSGWLRSSYDYLKQTDPVEPQVMMRHYKDGVDLAKTTVGSLVRGDMDRMLKQLEAKWNFAKNSLALMRASRPEPMCIVLQGAPGIGKTLQMSYFHERITLTTNPDIRAKKELDPTYDVSSHCFVKDTGKYWNGYSPEQHTTMMMDDAALKKAVPGAEGNDFETIMRVVNSAPASLDMADVESKGNVYFRSPLVLLSTNLDQDVWHSQSSSILTTPDALMRRLQLFLTVVPRDLSFFGEDGKLRASEYAAADRETRDKVFTYTGTYRAKNVSFDSMRAVADFAAKEMVLHSASHLRLKSAVASDAIADLPVFEPHMGAPPPEPRGSTLSASSGASVEVADDSARFTLPDKEETISLPGLRRLTLNHISECSYLIKALTYLGEIKNLFLGVRQFLVPFAMLSVVAASWYMVYAMIRSLCGMFSRPTKLEPHAQDPTPFMANVRKNMYALAVCEGKDCYTVRLGAILFVTGQYALMPYHFLTQLQATRHRYVAGSSPALRNLEDGSWITVPWETFSPDGPNVAPILGDSRLVQDLCVVRIGGRAHKDITGTFMSQGLSRPLDLGYIGVTPNFYPRVGHELPNVVYSQMLRYGNSIVEQAVSYKFPSEKGDCGMVLVSQGLSGRVHTVGMHVAGGDGGTGAAGVVYRNQLEVAISKIDTSVHMVVTPASVTKESFEAHGGDLGCLSVALTTYKNGMPDKPNPPPSMVQSQVHDWSRSLFSTNKVPVDISEAATEVQLIKYTRPAVLPEGGVVAKVAYMAATQALSDMGMPSALDTVVLTNDEAWSGMYHGVRFAEPINNKTSTGYPWQNMGHTKDRIVDANGRIVHHSVTTQAVFAEADALMELLRRGNEDALEHVLFKVAPKRELRPVEKGPRVIQAAPIHLVLVWRRLFWRFMGHYSEWSPEKELGIGLDPYVHWSTLKYYLSDYCPPQGQAGDVGAGDYSMFDQCQEKAIALAIGSAVVDRYGTCPYNGARRLLWTTTNGPRIVFRNVVYQLHKGMPSGHPATSVANGLYNCTLFRMCYTSLLLKGSEVQPFPGSMVAIAGALTAFKENVRLSVTGDDNIFSSKQQWFNEMALPRVMAFFGARYTLDTKQGAAATPFRPIEQVSYLGRGFRFEAHGDGTWKAPLRLESIGLMGQYAEKDGQLCPEWYRSTAEQIVQELSLHDQGVWDTWIPQVILTFCESGILPHFQYMPGNRYHRFAQQPRNYLAETDLLELFEECGGSASSLAAALQC